MTMTPSPSGVDSDPDLFKILTEVDMIAHMAKNEFERLLPDGMTQAQFGILNRITRLKTQETVSELAAAFQVTQPTMTSTLKRLSHKNYITFKPDKRDRRIKRVAVTKAGSKSREQVILKLAPLLAAQGEAIGALNFERLLADLARIRMQFESRLSMST